MADDPEHRDKPEDSDNHDVDSVMADDTETPSTRPGKAPDAMTEAMKALQRQIANKFRTRQAEKVFDAPSQAEEVGDAESQALADLSDDDLSEIAQRPKKIVMDADAADFAKRKAKFLKRKAAGVTKTEEEIAFMRAETAETARQRKLQRDAEFDDPIIEESDGAGNDLFVGSDHDLPDLLGLLSDEDDKPKKRGRKGKDTTKSNEDRPSKRAKKTITEKNRKLPGQDYSQADLEGILGKTKTSSKKASKSVSKKAAKSGPSMTNTSNLRGSNIIRDAAANEHLPDQPTFQGTGRRLEAMKQLIAGVPTESKDTARYDKQALEVAIKKFEGPRSVTATEDGNWNVRGLKTNLKHYQILGTAFMRERELGGDEPRGGINADEMGLGKTLMTLANIVNGLPRPKHKGPRTTLIVASPALLNQWNNEINTHCFRRSESKWGLGGVLQHRAGHRLDLETLSKADIVLTTYHEVNRSYPNAPVPENLITAQQKVGDSSPFLAFADHSLTIPWDLWWREYWAENRKELHRLKFLRIVLDEAQQIKNHRSVTSMACRSLTATHYWALTGTPIYNGISEFYSLFKFLRVPHTESYKIFKSNFCDPNDPNSIERLNVFLRTFMVRRTHQDRLFGTKLLSLPNASERNVALEFSDVEREIYTIVKNRIVNRINCIAKQEGRDGLQRKVQHIWTMILRLRQLCGHVLLIQGIILDILEREDFEKLNRLADSQEEMNDEGTALLVHLKNVLSSRNPLNTVEGSNGATITETQIVATGTVDIDQVEGDIGGRHGQAFHFKKYLRTLANSDKWTEMTERATCVACRQTPANPHISDCFHIYCLQCLTDMQHQAARRGYDSARCAECGSHYTSIKPCEGLEDIIEESPASSPPDSQAETVTSGKKKKKKKDCDDWINMAGDMLPSAKTRAAKAQVLVWLKEDPVAKIIIYTQFLPMVRILERVCNGEQWDFCKYTGEMSHDARSKEIVEFSKNKKKKILLASLKAGGLGLNLTMASRVLLLDPYWNSACEQQAFARVYRIGQTKETQLCRLVITNTIDAAMVALKARKDQDIDAVMNDEKRKEALNVEDLMRLFGEVREDEGGKPFIFAQEPEEFDGGDQEHLRVAAVDSDDEEAFMGNEE